MSHSGKSLSEVPYADIHVGMEVISAIGNPGKVGEKLDKAPDDLGDENWIFIRWDNLNESSFAHHDYDKVKVK